MPVFLKNLGLECLAEDENTYHNLVGHVLTEGKPITGYYGLPYINQHYGWAQMIGRVNQSEKKEMQFSGLDTHCAGICYWDVRISSVMEDVDNDDPLSKVLVVRGMDGMSLAAVHVVNADVLPSFAEDEVVRLQMIAFPEEISYYPDGQAYEVTVEPDEFGKRIMLGENALFPIGIFAETDKVPVKTITQIRGIVKRLLWGEVKIGEETIHPFIDCIVDTTLGEIEILHTIEDVDESQREHIKVGATVNCMCYLSGDAAIYEYEKGIVCTHDNHLKLLAYSMATGDPERMRRVLADNFSYHSETSGKHINNRDEFIEYVNYVHTGSKLCHPHYATITVAPEDGVYPVGTRCLVLTYGDEENFTSIVFMSMDEEDRINQVYLSKDSRYRFKVDDPLPEPESVEMIIQSRTALDAMLCRARFHLLVPYETDENAVITCIEQHRGVFVDEADKLADESSIETAFVAALEFGIRKRGKICYDKTLLGEVAKQFVKDHSHTLGDKEGQRETLTQSLLYLIAIGYLCEDDIPRSKSPR